MSANTDIEWADDTFNTHWGCVKIAPECANCYADSFDHRLGGDHWGPNSPRRFFGGKHWAEPEKCEDDYRAVKFPPPGPYWCSGYGDGHAIVVAFLPEGVQVTDWWPEAANIDSTNREAVTFTDRFPCPDWWDEVACAPATDGGKS